MLKHIWLASTMILAVTPVATAATTTTGLYVWDVSPEGNVYCYPEALEHPGYRAVDQSPVHRKNCAEHPGELPGGRLVGVIDTGEDGQDHCFMQHPHSPKHKRFKSKPIEDGFCTQVVDPPALKRIITKKEIKAGCNGLLPEAQTAHADLVEQYEKAERLDFECYKRDKELDAEADRFVISVGEQIKQDVTVHGLRLAGMDDPTLLPEVIKYVKSKWLAKLPPGLEVSSTQNDKILFRSIQTVQELADPTTQVTARKISTAIMLYELDIVEYSLSYKALRCDQAPDQPLPWESDESTVGFKIDYFSKKYPACVEEKQIEVPVNAGKPQAPEKSTKSRVITL